MGDACRTPTPECSAWSAMRSGRAGSPECPARPWRSISTARAGRGVTEGRNAVEDPEGVDAAATGGMCFCMFRVQRPCDISATPARMEPTGRTPAACATGVGWSLVGVVPSG